MTTFFQSVSQVDNNIIKSQDKISKKVFLYSKEKANNFAMPSFNFFFMNQKYIFTLVFHDAFYDAFHIYAC